MTRENSTEPEPRPQWEVEADRLNRISHEAVSGRQPVSDPDAPSPRAVAEARDRSAQTRHEDDERAPTTDQLRTAIDEGRARDKIAVSDPAAAPLGTDAEAGGHPPTPHQRAEAARMIDAAPDRRARRSTTPWLALLLVVAVLCVAVVAVWSTV